MIKEFIKYLLVVLVVSVSVACTSSPDKPKPYWLQSANSFMSNGVELYQRQQYRASTKEFTRALNAYQRFDYVQGLMQAYLNLAKSEIAQNNISKAQGYLRSLSLLVEENSFNSMRAHIDIMQSSIFINSGESEQAVELLGKYFDLTGENKMSIADDVYMALLINRTRVAVKTNMDSSRWVDIYKSRAGQSDIHRARLSRFEGQLAGGQKNINLINQSFISALHIYREQANPRAVLHTLKEWGKALAENNQLEDSAKRFEAAYKVAVSSLDKNEIINVLTSLLRVYKALNDEENIERVQMLLKRLD